MVVLNQHCRYKGSTVSSLQAKIRAERGGDSLSEPHTQVDDNQLNFVIQQRSAKGESLKCRGNPS
jgi:hypothetical protein